MHETIEKWQEKGNNSSKKTCNIGGLANPKGDLLALLSSEMVKKIIRIREYKSLFRGHDDNERQISYVGLQYQ